MTGGGVEGLETPVIEDEQLHPAERPQETGIATIAAGEGEVGEQLGNALVVCTENWIRLDARQRLGNAAT